MPVLRQFALCLPPAVLALLVCLTASALPASADDSLSPASATRYDGLTLDEWRLRIKNLDPAAPESAAAVPGLIAIVRDDQVPWFSRRQAALTLGRMGTPARDAVPLLIELAGNDDGDAETSPRLWSIKALALFGAEARDAAPLLIEIARDTKQPSVVRQAPLEALAQIGATHPQVIPALISLLNDPPAPQDSDGGQLRELAAESLGVIGPPAQSAVPALIRASGDESESLRRKTLAALGSVGGGAAVAVPALLEAMLLDASPAVRDAAMEALGKVGPVALPFLEQLLEDEDPEARWRSATAIGRMGTSGRPAAPALVKVIDDESPLVRMSALEALAAVSAERDSLLQPIVKELASDDRQHRMRAFRLLTSLGAEARAAVPSLRELQNDPRAQVRRAAAEALEKIEAQTRPASRK